MKQKVKYEFKATIYNGNEKLIKTSANRTEIVQTKNGELIHSVFGGSYPTYQGEDFYAISEEKFDNAKKNAKSV